MTGESNFVLIATDVAVLRVDPQNGSVLRGEGFGENRPTGVTGDPWVAGRAWCATARGGVYRTDDWGATWAPSGLDRARLMAVVASPGRRDRLWAGTEPSQVWRSDDGGSTWTRTTDLDSLPSSSEWAFPPRPDTHHVRWIACHPADPEALWVAVEAGALIRTTDGGETWSDRVRGGPYDTHELAVHPEAPQVLRVSAGDGYFESRDGGDSWASPMDGLDVRYLRSVAIDPGDPETVLVSGATGPRSAYVSGRSDGRLFRRTGTGRWERVTRGWPDPPTTIAPLLLAGQGSGDLWAADDRGLHHSEDSGATWRQTHSFDRIPNHLRGITLLAPKKS